MSLPKRPFLESFSLLAVLPLALSSCGGGVDALPPASMPLVGLEAPRFGEGPVPRLEDLLGQHDAGVCEREGALKLAGGLASLLGGDCRLLEDEALARALQKNTHIKIEGDRVKVSLQLMEPLEGVSEGEHVTLDGTVVEALASRGTRLDAWARLADLPTLAASSRVRNVDAPFPMFRYTMSQAVSHTNASYLQGQGLGGAGVSVGILDGGFTGWSSLVGTELPAGTTAVSFPSSLGTGASEHGTAVAETVHDLAPEAALTLVAYETDLDFCDAVDWLVGQGVDLITTSTGTTWAEPLDGRGRMAQCAKEATDLGIPFTAASGNHGDRHYYGTFSGTTWHTFGSGNILYMNVSGGSVYTIPAGTPLSLTMSWDDWGADPGAPTSAQNYDLYLMVYYSGSWYVAASGTTVQNGDDAPREGFSAIAPLTSYYGVAVRKVSATRNVALNLFGLEASFDPDVRTNEYSVVSPCVAEGVTCVGAVHWATGPGDVEACDEVDNDLDGNTDENCLEAYSSRGPAIPDELTGLSRPKVDLVSSDCVDTVTYGDYDETTGFCGTSAATPHAAGLLALYLELFGDPELALAAMGDKALDMGAAGYDFQYGDGLGYGDCESADGDGDGLAECAGDYWAEDCNLYPGSLPEGHPNFCDVSCPCHEGQGDCDTHAECESGTFCEQLVGTDYCSSCGTLRGEVLPVGHEQFCNPACPCEAGEGDCDTNADCATGLACVNDVGALYGFARGVDVCQGDCHTSAAGSASYCTSACPCEAGEGDCDTNAECAEGTWCEQVVGTDFCVECGTLRGVPLSPGHEQFCSPACPCGAGLGDCDTDADCEEGLHCQDNAGLRYGYSYNTDVCQADCHSSAAGSPSYCSVACPCEAGEGDCDSDAECVSGTRCGERLGTDYCEVIAG